ncbi:T9SS type A sorting domain-containing protein [Mariniflexile sp. HMF6888]|uniref:T9SS type A sorting domain-containing protein n=1 Tax=Mariniflexile sp. HMF6888 TaxID=3373086 RepID=UPI003791D590
MNRRIFNLFKSTFLIAVILLSASFSNTDDAKDSVIDYGCHQVEWTSQIGVTVNADGGVRSTTNTSYGSNAYSVDKIPASENGSFEFTAFSMFGFVGLSDTPSYTGYSSIDYAIQLWSPNIVYIVESGEERGYKTTWSSGDVFKIEKIGTQITYSKNGTIFYTSTAVANSDLYADFSFGNEGTGFDAPKLCITDVLATSSETPYLKDSYKLYPNPSSGVFHFSSPFTGKIDVFSTSGQLIKTLEPTLTSNIDLSELHNGTYFIKKVSHEGMSEIQKVIVKE